MKIKDLLTRFKEEAVYRPLKEIAELKRGKTITKKMVTPGDIPVVAGGLTPSYYHNEANREADIISVASSGSAGTILYWNKPIYLSDAFSIKGQEGVILTRYLYYILKNNQDYFYSLTKGAVILHFYISDIEDFLIPVPSLEVQKEMAAILDEVTNLINYLDTAIPKAIQLSKKGLLASLEESLKFKEFDNLSVTTSEIDQLSLKKVAELKRGKTITKKTAIPGNIPVVAGGLKPSYYHNEANRDGDIISVSGSGASSGTILYWDQPIYLSDAFSIKGIEGIANTRYLYYTLKNSQDYFYSLVKGAVIPHFYISDIEDFVIPVPSLETQKQVVSILDQAEVSSLSLVEYFNTINTKKDIAYKSILSKFFATSENDPILI